jgi:hypothetical protein
MKIFYCDICNSSYTSRQSFRYHNKFGCIKAKFENKMPFQKRGRHPTATTPNTEHKKQKVSNLSIQSFDAFRKVVDELYEINESPDNYAQFNEQDLIRHAITTVKVKAKRDNPELDILSTVESLGDTELYFRKQTQETNNKADNLQNEVDELQQDIDSKNLFLGANGNTEIETIMRDINTVQSMNDLHVCEQKHLFLTKLCEFVDECTENWGDCLIKKSIFESLSALTNEPDLKPFVELIGKNLSYRQFKMSPDNDVTVDNLCLKIVEAEQRNRKPVSLSLVD